MKEKKVSFVIAIRAEEGEGHGSDGYEDKAALLHHRKSRTERG